MSRACRKAASARYWARRHEAREESGETITRHLYWRDGATNLCGLCGREIERIEDATLDHKQPISRDGAETRENGQLAHAACNRRKGNGMESAA